VSAGPLQARVATDPWHLAFEDAAGAPVLSEAIGTGSSLDGTLGYSAGGTWFHATRVVDEAPGAEYSAELATTDPLGGRIRVRLAPDADGVLTLTATAQAPPVEQVQQVGISFAARDGERFLGFGERSNAVDQRGNTIEDYVAEGPYRPVERPAIAGFVPPWGYHPRDDATYFPIPWLLSSAGYGVLVDSDDRSEFHLASDSPGDWSAAVDSSELRMRVFAGPTPAAALGRFTARLGRQPAAAAPWYFGPWFQPKGDDAANLETLRRAGAPASVVQTYTHYLPCGDQRGKEADQRRRTDFFHAAGLAVTTYFNPMICTSYEPTFDEAAAEGDLTKNALGQPYEYRYTGASQFLVGQFDFSSPAARAFYGKLLGGAVADGYDGWMEDFGEYTPTDSVSSDGTPGPQMHNRYPVLYHQAAYEFSSASGRALARFNRSGWTGAARYSQIVWGGDPTTDWGFDGLASAIRNGLTMGLSGVSLWGSDIGGYFSLSAPQLTPELLARWIEFGAVSGIMRTEADGFAIPGKSARPQIFDPGTLPIWRRYAKLRTQLYPYLAAAEREYDTTGLPIMRQLSLAYPDDRAANVRDDEFLFGPDLLAAPVIEPGAATRSLYLPAGQWVDLWRSAAMGGPNASLGLRRPAVVAGGRNISVPAPLDELPLFARAGAILPLLAPDVDTLTSYGRSPGMIHLGDRAGRMRLLAFPRGGSQAAIGPGESASSREGAGGWTFEVRGASERRYALQASLATLERPFIPCALQLGSRRLPARRWTYDRAARVLRASFTLRSGTLVARRSCGLARHNRSHQHRRRR
jgi:alpha-glucosidase (family GH31 glycosyl hydrolase)